jgi:hypothetical protein
MENVTIMIPFTIDAEWVDGVVCTAFDGDYGGCWYWIRHFTIARKPTQEAEFMTEIISRGGAYKFKDEDDIEHIFDLNTLQRGFEKYAKWCTTTGRELLTDAGDIDATEADIIVQFGVFGDIIYG